MKQGGDGGCLSGFLGNDWLRALVYKQFYLTISSDRSNKYILLFAQRTNSRRWRYPGQIIRHIDARFNEVCSEVKESFYRV